VSDLVSVDEIRAAARRLSGVTVRTPLVPYPRSEPALLIKPESLQPTGSFKLRGAYATIDALSVEQRRRGVAAHTSGNHGHAVAYAAAALGVRAVIVMPETASEVKVAATAALGADRFGYELVPPFDDPRIIAGQGTVGLEIAADCPEVDLVLVPISGGGLIAGVATAIKELCPRAVVVGVEPEFAADARDSLHAGRRVAWAAADTGRTVADALRVEQVGELPFQHILHYVDEIVTISEDEIKAAIRRTACEARLVAEPGGVVAIAAHLFRRHQLPAGRTSVAVLSGGNIAPGLLAEVLASQPPGEPSQRAVAAPGAGTGDAGPGTHTLGLG
jgi:threonine dehydratase